jgi:uncharacterized protein YcnI/copper(I)-binding protein
MTRLFALLAALAAATPAAAHITLERAEGSPGSSYKAVLRVPHGCDGSSTVKLSVQVPEGFIAVKPMPKPGWTIDIKKGPYAKTYTFMHGIKLSQGVQEIVWSGKLEDAFYDEFVMSGFIADTLAPGAVLAFPTVQDCEKGSERWTDVPAPGQDAHALKSPAPILRLVAAQNGGHMHMQMQTPALFQHGAIAVESPWLRATPKGAKVVGGYMTITNHGKEADRFVGGSIDGAGRFETHEMSMKGDVMQMRALPDGIEIKPGETVELKPGGFHVMGLDLSRAYAAGETVKGTLKFEKAGEIAVEFSVAPLGAPGPAHQHH